MKLETAHQSVLSKNLPKTVLKRAVTALRCGPANEMKTKKPMKCLELTQWTIIPISFSQTSRRKVPAYPYFSDRLSVNSVVLSISVVFRQVYLTSTSDFGITHPHPRHTPLLRRHKTWIHPVPSTASRSGCAPPDLHSRSQVCQRPQHRHARHGSPPARTPP